MKVRGTRVGLNGDTAVAYAVKHANVDVIAAYPITPQTIMVEKLSEFVNNGELDAAFVPVESEHSAMSTCVGASLAGARVFTATASQGLALMYEILWIASSLRTTIVMAIGNRALSAPINIHCSHDDAYAARDTGWIQFFAENVQEAYDLTLLAFKVSESKDILLPTMVNLDGFILTHSLEGLYIFDEKEVEEFLPPKEPINPIDYNNPMTYGPLDLYDYYFEHKRQQAEAMIQSYKPIVKILNEFSEFSGRKYAPLKTLATDDADVILVVLGSSAGTVRYVARKLRKKGEKIGVVSLTLYRPFPANDIIEVLGKAKAVVVMDRSYSFGSPGAQLFMDIAATLYNLKERPLLMNAVYGLGGRDLMPQHVVEIYERGKEAIKVGEVKERQFWVGVRG